jgi:hypothetical protein
VAISRSQAVAFFAIGISYLVAEAPEVFGLEGEAWQTASKIAWWFLLASLIVAAATTAASLRRNRRRSTGRGT